METRTAGTPYYWDGLKRGTEPYLVVQYTLSGYGCLSEGGNIHRLTAGRAFSVSVPSAHAYYLPPDSPEWTFFWINIRHPYLVNRIGRQQKLGGNVLTIPADSRLMARMLTLFEGFCHPIYPDAIAHEQALFDFMFEYERFVHHLVYPAPEREGLLAEVRDALLPDLARPLGVAELAAARGMSRSRFSHHFKATTGVSPAHYLKQLRLEEATHRLLHTDQKLEEIASATGFANANHLCKVFRRHFHLSPGEFRRQTPRRG
jgi:AraC-like DNA-binding protein